MCWALYSPDLKFSAGSLGISLSGKEGLLFGDIGHRAEDAGICDQFFSPLPQALPLPQLRTELLVEAHITAYIFESLHFCICMCQAYKYFY